MDFTTHQQLDIRELDNLYLATIAGDDYFEERWIVKRSNGVRTIIGRASDWPLIAARAETAELAQLLTASERRSAEADTHCAELISRIAAYEEHIAALETALADAAAERTAADIAANPTVFVVEQPPAHVTALVERLKSPATESPDTRRKCPHCAERPKLIGMQAHIERKHPDQVQVVASPTPPIVLAIELGERPWRCAQCDESTHARSLSHPALCIKCVVAAVEPHTNGHQAVA